MKISEKIKKTSLSIGFLIATFGGFYLLEREFNDFSISHLISDLEKKSGDITFNIEIEKNKLSDWARNHILTADTNFYWERLNYLESQAKMQKTKESRQIYYWAFNKTLNELEHLKSTYHEVNFKVDSLEKEKKNIVSKINSLENKKLFP